MKKLFFASAVLLAVFMLSSNVMGAGISLRFTGGYYHMSYADFNDWVKQFNRAIDEANQGIPESLRIPNMDEITWVPEFGGEILFAVAPAVSIGAGVAIISGSTSLAYLEQGYGFDIDHKVRVYPFTATAYVRFPAIPIKPFLYGGMGFYKSKLIFDYYEYIAGDRDGYNAELTDWQFGVHGGGGISFNIAPMISLDLDVRLRWADLKGYEGTARSVDGETRDVFLAKGTINDTYIYGPEDVAYKDDWQEASVNLSGYGFFVGLNIGF
jgi:opacity protein-like surface antigen